ncbi:type II toxin-antitoxin system RelE/ParE family toxin [Methylopila sp. M107]|uniref:type II toxin-antitoxin system RelE/ParE family toxin n=1 Tax=Methylopila sp. M107 TaxID=1101190 RepID=UPI000373AB10|nr:type II toxin-antitoxin system RelE/ParE family toxin [Methylopila sp. M107]
MKLRLSPRAREDIQEIGRYLRERSPGGALQVRNELKAALQLIREHPNAGRDLGGHLRRLPASRVPYLIFYRIDELANAVDVVTIRHAARAPEDG